MTGQFQMVMRTGPSPGKTFSLSKKESFAGRDVDNEIVINDVEVSRKHFRILLQNDSYVIEDLGSTNGTFINETRITAPTSLRAGDTVRAGDNVTLVFEAASDPNATIQSGEKASPPPGKPAPPPSPAPVLTPQPSPTPQATPAGYAGQVPLNPAAPDDKSSNRRTLMIGCLGLFVITACVVSAGLYYIDTNLLWCDVFGTLIGGC